MSTGMPAAMPLAVIPAHSACASGNFNLTSAVPALAGALFKDFPGTPGATVQVRI
jgi:hypothetical protein